MEKELTNEEVSTEVVAPQVKKTKKQTKKEYDLTPVRGRFEFTEMRGKQAPLVFSYGSIYKDVPITQYKLVDGEIATLPRMVAQHLNTAGCKPVYEFKLNERGKAQAVITSHQRRYGFFPIDFEDVGQYDSKLTTISYSR